MNIIKGLGKWLFSIFPPSTWDIIGPNKFYWICGMEKKYLIIILREKKRWFSAIWILHWPILYLPFQTYEYCIKCLYLSKFLSLCALYQSQWIHPDQCVSISRWKYVSQLMSNIRALLILFHQTSKLTHFLPWFLFCSIFISELLLIFRDWMTTCPLKIF